MALFQQILSVYPKHAEALHLMGLALNRTGNYSQAVKSIKRAIKINPKTAYYHRNLALLLMDAGRLQEAGASFKQAIARDPKDADSHNDLGVIYSRQNRTREAIAEYKKSINKNPNNFRAYSNLGNDLLKTSELEEAEECQRKAIEINPRYMDAYLNLGMVLRLQGRFEDSIEVFQQVLMIDAKYKEAHIQLGISLMQMGRLDDAIESFGRAIGLDSSCKEAHRHLGFALKKQGKIDEALAAYRSALKIDPEFVDACIGLGSVLSRQGKFDEANEAYRQAVRIDPRNASAYKGLIRNQRHADVDDELVAMERVYAQKGIPDKERMTLCFGLGAAFERQERCQEGFRYIAEANAFKRSTYDYGIEEDQDYFRRLKELFTSEFFTKHKAAGCADDSPIFILGMPRSGTTLVEQILASHSKVFGAGELNHLSDISMSMGGENSELLFPECLLGLEEDAFADWGAEYISRLGPESGPARFITDKMPHNFLRIGLIKLILPNARVIHCMRDPMDTCLSIYKTDFSSLHKYAYDLTELGQYYKLYLDLMDHWQRVLPGFVFNIQYEDVVSQQEAQTRRLLEYCGLPWEEACLAFHKTERNVATASLAQVRQPIYKGSVQLWKSYGNHLAPLEKALSS